MKLMKGARKSFGFTLMESLLALAMIIVVAMISSGVVSRALERSRETLCVARLKASGQAILLHAGEHRGEVLMAWASASPGDLAAFPHLATHPQKGMMWYQYLHHHGYLPDLSVLACPSYPPYRYEKGLNEPKMQTYGLRRTFDDSRYEPAAILTRVLAPGRFVLLADSSKPLTWIGQSYYISYPGNRAETIHLRHRGRANLFFLDGSIRSLSSQEIVDLGDGWNDRAFEP